ncbi:MAG: hypothetical protein HYZ42_15360 [Bacteroidetes bacterium]|nr:hypothetical protein [Bacteroidota bacterium]
MSEEKSYDSVIRIPCEYMDSITSCSSQISESCQNGKPILDDQNGRKITSNSSKSLVKEPNEV